MGLGYGKWVMRKSSLCSQIFFQNNIMNFQLNTFSYMEQYIGCTRIHAICMTIKVNYMYSSIRVQKWVMCTIGLFLKAISMGVCVCLFRRFTINHL